MVVFPNAKINLGLRITSKRNDGYHELDTVFYPIPLFDILEVVSSTSFHFQTSGKKIEGNEDNNLCIKAYQLLKKDFSQLPSIDTHLHKNIPMGAGMGGGSADGAFMIKLLNEKFNLGLNDSQMCSYALQLGSDCPIFIYNNPCYARGRGELLEEISIDLSPYYLLIVSPGIHVSTADAFKGIQPNPRITSSKEIIQLPIKEWKKHLINDFEATVFDNHPVLKSIKEKIYELGATYASMTGSGSTIYGLFEEAPDFKNTFDSEFETHLIKPSKL
jgi:4-diphosphocytidyl-2-C-methyl-D-erythritol kinase